MIVIALAYVLVVCFEAHYLRQRNAALKRYMILYCFLFIVSELMYYYKEQFQIIQLIKLLFASWENAILLK